MLNIKNFMTSSENKSLSVIHDPLPTSSSDTSPKSDHDDISHQNPQHSWQKMRERALSKLTNTASTSSAKKEVTPQHSWQEIREGALSKLTNAASTSSTKKEVTYQKKKKKKEEISILEINHKEKNKGLLQEPSDPLDYEQKPTSSRSVIELDEGQTLPDTNSKKSTIALKQFSGKNGLFYFLTPQGKLHRYDPSVDEIINTGLSNVSHFTMGADGKPYALINQRLARLDPLGYIKDICSGTINTENDSADIAVSPLADKAFILNKNGQLFTQSLINTKEPTRKEPTRKVPLPQEATKSSPHSVAIDAKGHVWLLGIDNQVWTANLNTEHPNNEAIWVPTPKASNKLQSLEILPDGRVGARTADEELLVFNQDKLASSSAWHSVPFQTLTQSSFHQVSEAMHKPNSAQLTSFLGAVSTSRVFSKNSLFTPIKSFHNVVKSIPTLYKDLKNFDYKNKQTSSINHFYKQVKDDLKTLQKASLPPTFKSTSQASFLLQSELTLSIDNDTNNLLDTLKKDVSKTPSLYKRYRAPKNSKNLSDDNILTLLKNTRTAIYGQDDAITKKLQNLIDEGLYFQHDTSPYQGLMAKLLSDHASLIKTAQTLSNAPNTQSNEIIRKSLIEKNDSIPNLLLRSGISNSDPFANASQGFDAIQAIFRQQTDMLNRITNRYAPIINGSDSNEETSTDKTAELFSRLLHSMKPGDSIGLGKNADTGFNTETCRLVFSGNWAGISAGNLNTWLIPVLDFGKLKDVNLSLTKTEEGLKIRVNRSREKYLQTGLRTGIGVVELPKLASKTTGTTWGFEGWEIALKNKHSRGKTDAIELTLKDQGNGNLQEAITEIMTGKADLFDLMRQSNEISSTHTSSKQHNVSVGNVGVLAGGITMPGWSNIIDNKSVNTLPPVGKVLGALVPELAVNFGSKTEHSQSTNNKGETVESTTQQKFGLQSITGNMIGVGVFESDYMNHILPGDMMLGPNTSSPGETGRAGIPSMLPGAVLGKTFGLLSPTAKTVSMASSNDGTPDNIHVDLLISRSSQLAKNIRKYENLSKVPGLKNAVDALTHQQGKKAFNKNQPINLKLEIQPAQLKQLPTDKEERKKALLLLAKDLSNFRISEISVENERHDYKSKGMPVPALTRSIGAFVATSSQLAHISCIYDQDSAEKHALHTLQKMASFPESVWATANTQQRMTRLKQELGDVIDTLGEAPSHWTHGQDLQHAYQKDFKELTTKFNKTLDTALLKRFAMPQQKKLLEAFNELKQDIKTLRKTYSLPPFKGPAIVTSGPLFTNPYSGKMQPESNLKAFKEVPIKEIMEKIKTLSKQDLSSLKGKKLDKEKKVAFGIIDDIKKQLGTASDIDPEVKNKFLANLYLLPARPSNQEQLSSLLHELDQLAPRH